MKKYIIIGLVLTMASLSSCTMDPEVADSGTTDVNNTDGMRNFINGSYALMEASEYMGRDMELAGEVRADNVYANGSSGRFLSFSRMDYDYTDNDITDLFQQIYSTIANANVLINLDKEDLEGEEADINQVLGEAYTMRAFAHFDLIRLFGQAYIDDGSDLGVSYIKEFKSGDLNIPRGKIDDNKKEIYDDIQSAIDHFEQGEDSQWADDNTNFTLNAAYALKSRVGTYFRDYDKVLEASENLIGKYELLNADEYVDYWKGTDPDKTSSIFEIQQFDDDNASIDGLAQIYRGDDYGDIQAFDDLLDDADFDNSDIRASSAMIDYEGSKLRNMGKYPSMGSHLGADNIKAMRYAEVVLNYAEALEETGDAGQALTYLNKIPEHRNAQTYSEATLDNILKERRKELMFEGYRFFDLARTGRDIPDIDPGTVNNHGAVPAGDNKFAFPIPSNEINNNPETTQNPGYTGS